MLSNFKSVQEACASRSFLQHRIQRMRLGRRTLTGAAAGYKVLSGPCVIKMTAEGSSQCSVSPQNDSKTNLQEYMSHAAENFANIELPMGGKISSLDQSHIELVIPRIQLFDVWLQPKAQAELSTFPEKIVFASRTDNCRLDGSHHVQQFKLDERFNLDVNMQFTWRNIIGNSRSGGEGTTSTSTIFAEGNMVLEVDIPPPFSFIPRSVLQSTANTALSASFSLILNSFVNRLAQDYSAWAQNPQLRKLRLQAETKALP
ncbi:hypothetical protein CEUSTIGMA_g3312.t1 [Chlamydomonas eustigma]|uniref:Uncharacterized protein n=1 Tax=Chlamydomonas eustigma TaxID=1157962 RepID=A0A250WYU5_9CHLO|nr:hypothetical protein CEUSTIGMA_g3312.t1 [Chlamydomonas eustigma]|eukprot:GAX75869.1 hypothetical protein CEUSTIGMA_g3312.t1 [Chlamydomonas eustigma]